MECMNKDQTPSDKTPTCCNNDECIYHYDLEYDTEHNTFHKTFTSHGGFLNNNITSTQVLNTTALYYTVS